ncbi:PQQ-dependent sugar dehydrogenase [Streptosporangium lutulentum]|uniref:Glucose/arabinose dehydrogenase n=1 Tax=Streptosporangium lutulentum TaxID=1461250 RepID=A0ABT9Q8P3_9ACTN|nr:PQQ-dependent sugar dehydrogenase [Streptosporangium lutulentum]MDP9843117.1 glucose/arabinose dehydrogenase [Streptosporangium lutulentum]
MNGSAKRTLLAGAAAAAVLAGLLTAPSIAVAQDDSAPPDSAFQKVTLNDTPGEPVDLAVLPDSRVLHTTRDGTVWMHDPATGLNTKAAELDVYEHDEEGLQSIALDPDFGKKNTWVYLYYSPPMDTPVDDPSTPDVNEGDAPNTGTAADWERFEGVIRLSRFQFTKNKIDLGSEQQILDVPVDRGICCHVGGDIVFDAAGNLYLSTGDDTNPFSSDGYTPIDERPDRNPSYDAQRSSGNTNDLRGKVLRIHPKNGGGYTVPKGNLFAPGTAKTRPEIYAMGLRNPFRIEINRKNGDLYVADYSPDADEASPARGPAGYGKWAIVRKPANYGWPYCATAELPYVDYDFGTGASGAPFDCAAPVNESPHNTGLRKLPPVQQPDVWYPYSSSAEFPELGTGGIGPMAGPVYHFDKKATHGRTPRAWPKYFDGAPLFYEWTRDYTKAFRLNRDGKLSKIESVLPSITFDNGMDMEFGPDGALYVLEYGDGYFAENPDAQLARIDYIGQGGNHSPTPKASADKINGVAPLTVTFSSEGTVDADGDRLRYEWDFDADGRVDSRQANPTFTYKENGLYRATLKVTDVGGPQRGRSAATSVEIVVGNAAPVVELVQPVEGQTFHFGDVVHYEVRVTDDQAVDCSRVQVTYILGHDQHGHPQTTANGCTGSITTTVPSGHDPETDDLSGVFAATYTDAGADGLPALTGTDEVVLQPAD